MNDPVTISYTLGIIILVGGAITVLASRIPARTISQLRDLTNAYEQRLHLLEEQNVENIKQIADLQGQIKVYKELPLQDIALAMKQISTVNENIAASNEKILTTLKTSLKLEQERQ